MQPIRLPQPAARASPAQPSEIIRLGSQQLILTTITTAEGDQK
ncbi:hypothetical protein [Kocuria marina]|jgi:hypothetical protein|nr:hypothetical protein [Kocuria indica]